MHKKEKGKNLKKSIQDSEYMMSSNLLQALQNKYDIDLQTFRALK